LVARASGAMRGLIGLPALAMLAGCATAPSTYSWGSYEEVIYASYVSHSDVPAEKQVELLEKDYQVARSENLRLPPGWHAHLGYLYYEMGKTDQARQELLTEKAEFPESAVFVNRLLASVQPPPSVQSPSVQSPSVKKTGVKSPSVKKP
jgi:hypothetical protein